MTVVELDSIGVAYAVPGGPVWAVRNASLSVLPRRITAVVGPSGSGKTTLLSVAGLVQRPQEGRVRFAGVDVTDAPERERLQLRRRQVGVVFQHGALIEHLTVLENVMLPLLAEAHASPNELAVAVLARMGLARHAGKLPSALSGGEAQRVAISRAVVRRPALVVADEPTASLDPASADLVRGCLRSLADEGTAVLVATHDPVTAEWADAVLDLGAILGGVR